jgi:hypothetical protein
MKFLTRLRPRPLDRAHSACGFDSAPLKSKKIGNITDLFIGAGGRNRTDMELPPEDFESSASTNFTTPARSQNYTNLHPLSRENGVLEM